MDDLIQFLNTGLFFGRTGFSGSESRLRQTGTIYPAVWIKNLIAKMPHHFLINALTWLHELMGNRVGLNKVRAEGNKYLAHAGFSCRDPARESDFQQRL
jgi:hypothetical protein